MISYIHVDIVRSLNLMTIANIFVAYVDNRIDVFREYMVGLFYVNSVAFPFL